MELPNQAPAATLVFQTMLAHGPLTRAEVDKRYQELTSAGYQGRQPPFDAFPGRALCDRG